MKHSKRARRKNHISPDGKWETMARPRGLLRYLPTGMFFGRTRYKGELLFKKLDTTDYDEACERLPDYIKRWKADYDRALANGTGTTFTTWKLASELLDIQLTNRAKAGDLLHRSSEARRAVIRKIVFHWPSIENMYVRELPSDECLKFFAEARVGEGRFLVRPREKGRSNCQGDFQGGKQCNSSYNRLLGVMDDIVEVAQQRDSKLGYGTFENPLENIPWATSVADPPLMPTDEEWQRILTAMLDTRRVRFQGLCKRQQLCAKFLAMTGARICEVLGRTRNTHKADMAHPGFRWHDVKSGYNIITCAKKRKDKKWKKRVVPWIAGAGELMDEIRNELYTGDDNAIVFAGIPPHGLGKALKRALKRSGLYSKFKKFSQHKIRHLFGTKCAEAGCRWKHIGEWLGHADGGILAAKLYSHVRAESSFEQAAMVSYGKTQDRPNG